MIMDTTTKFKLVEKIMTSEDDVLLNEIKLLLGLSDHDFWNELSDPVKASIQRGLAQSGRGETIPHEKVMAEIRARFFKA